LIKSSTLADVRCIVEMDSDVSDIGHLLIGFINYDDVLEFLISNYKDLSKKLFLEQIQKDSSFLERTSDIFIQNITENIHVCVCIYELLCLVSKKYLFSSTDKIIIRKMFNMTSENRLLISMNYSSYYIERLKICEALLLAVF